MRRPPVLKRLPLAALGAALLVGCAANGPQNLKVHEVNLQGGSNERLVWVYGTLNGNASSSIKLDGAAVDLRAQVQDALATPGSLSVNGQAVYRTPLTSSAQKVNVNRDASGQFTVIPLNGAVLSATYYTDGQNWFKLSAPGGRVDAQPSLGLRGAGQLTDDEADVLSAALRGQGNMAVAVLADTQTGVTVEPKPTESRRTSLYILPGVQVTQAAAPAVTTPPVPAPTPTTGGTMTTPPAPGGSLTFTEVARGTNASAASQSVQVATTDAQLRSVYAVAYGRQTPPPAPPALRNETVVAVFMGQRNTGGYSVNVERVEASGGVLNVTVRLNAPAANSLTTQALTSPWVMIRVPGLYTSVNVVESGGRTFR